MLLRGGTVLLHGTNDKVEAVQKDILIEAGKICKIENNIRVSSDIEIVDCEDTIISPGFIDTHHHVWQTLLKGRHANELLLEYFPSGNFQSSNHSPADIFWGQLGGCLELLDGGTTTVVDHSHVTYSSEHVYDAISATVSTGIRSVYCYTPTARIQSWNPMTMYDSIFEPFVMDTFDALGSTAPFGNGRVTLGFAFDGWFMPKEAMLPIFDKVKEYNIKTITTHYVRGAIQGLGSLSAIIEDKGLLDERMLFSHATNLTSQDLELIEKRNVHIATTPSSELQMAHGTPVAFRDDLGVQHRCGLGVDCHSNNSGSIVQEMRVLLQSARGMSNARFTDQEKFPRKMYKTVLEAFNLGTIQGARAIRMEDQIGSIAVGKAADLTIFKSTSPAMVCGAQHDPVAAIVLHSSPADIDMVIVDGRVVKRSSRLEAITLDERGRKVAGRDSLEWNDVAKELIERREGLQKKIEKIDFTEANAATAARFRVDLSRIVDQV